MAALHRNLITHILIRLPVKLLLRFRCVSKSFCSLIDSQEFIKLHLKHSAATITNPGLFLQDPVSWKLYYTTLCAVDTVQIVKCCDDDASIIGCCDGLAALTCEQRNRVLWNPSTKKSRALPKILIDVEDCAMNAVDGLGYDASTDDYKWVRIVQSPKHYLVSIVYSLKSNSWRRAHQFPFDSSGHIVGYGALSCGKLSWMAVEYSLPGERGKYIIVGFDLKDEKFRLVPLPDIKDDLSAHLSLEGLGGRLWLTYTTQRSSSTWVMKKFGVRESWTKMFSFSPKGESYYWLPGAAFDLFTYFVRPFVYTKTGKKVLLYEQSRGLCLYYLDELDFDSIKIPAPSLHSKAVRLCVESLVSLDAGTKIGVLNGEQRERKISCKRKIERGAHHHPRSVEEVFGDYKGCRAGIIKALTSDVKVFYQQCDPQKEELCLYGFPDEQWKVDSPAQELPIVLPEPAVGVNFSRDGMPEDDWLFSVLSIVMHGCWLLHFLLVLLLDLMKLTGIGFLT